jgi:phosphatidylserine/phosphatidylglycerophosphate/cardiolipin synthase-like enzyme
LQALRRAADRGVKVRIYLDGTKLAERTKTRSSRLIHFATMDQSHRDSFEFGCELPCVVRRKHRVRAVEIDMHQIIKT